MTDELILTTPAFARYVDDVRSVVDEHETPEAAIAALRVPFARLLWNDDWLPEEMATPPANSGMGGGLGAYLLYRNAERTLSISALVVSAGSTTPVHDHLAWGLVGLYRGEQHEEIFQRVDRGEREGRAELQLVERKRLRRGDFYELIPPEGDIHRVVAKGEEPSVSIHLLGNDVGCVHRHSFVPEEHAVQPFRSGYVNVECKD